MPGASRHAVAVLAAAAALLACGRAPSPPTDAGTVVAEVDGARITLQDLKTEIAARRGLSSPRDAGRATAAEVSRAVRSLVERTLVLREGERLGVAVSEAEVEEEVRRYRAGFPPGGLEKALLREGIPMEAWTAELSRSLRHRKAAAAIAAARATVTEEEVARAYRERRRELSRPERIRVRQLLFDAEEAAREAREAVGRGADPDEAARRLASEEAVPLSVDLGFLSREELPGDLREILFALREGEASPVVRRDGSFSVFILLAREPARTPDLAAAAPEIREEILAARRQEAFRRWLDGELARADVRVRESIVARLGKGEG